MTKDLEKLMGEDCMKFRGLCMDLVAEAQRLNLERDLVFVGVSWDFPETLK